MVMETITIINKSGKVVGTGKHLVNIFKDAKAAYNEKKAEMKAEHRKQITYKNAQKFIEAREETQSVASSRRSHRSRSSRHRHADNDGVSRPPLTMQNLSQISEGSVASSRRSRSSHHGSRRPTSPPPYTAPFEDEDFEGTGPAITRRHTDMPESQVSRRTLPPPYTLHRSVSNPDFSDKIDMNLAYGELHHPPPPAIEQEQELQATMSKLEILLTEAQCLQYTATAIISNLQTNPEAMAAVALTLAELSNILKSMSPGILSALKATSPAIFGLLASPQFLIAGGLAIGVTIVMFGGYKIIKNMQDNQKEAPRMEEAMVYDGLEMGSVESWRRGIADVESQSVSTSVDGEFITPEAARRKQEHIKDRAKEERKKSKSRKAESVMSESVMSESTVSSDRTIRQSDFPARSSSRKALPAPSESGRSTRSRKAESVMSESTVRSSSTTKSKSTIRPRDTRSSSGLSESGRSDRSRKESKGKELVVLSKEREKKKSPLSIFLNKHNGKGKSKEGSERSSHSRSHRPRMIEV
ncbi:hypothetical protein LHYA1_G003624 [Lachnellula hyalina]|uniref:Uncharacterized protein n=1 Tax=Lachnellula hyalina TaxID=1316788 RepID=A0A8H8R364_9HELO|nr:uncharacterized protein LHYA1_G003624 [Lachnellula hyalina]TVY27518.1 hypothetical protein LHYA1_G003624 [Lachnellula hyalina]